jgi:hypothetical protein
MEAQCLFQSSLLILCFCCYDRRWLDEHGDMARMVQDIQESKQQLQEAMQQQAKQLEDCKQQLKDQQARSVVGSIVVANRCS